MGEGIDILRLGERLRRTRRRRGLKLREVSEATGIPIPTLSRIERGSTQDVRSTTLMALVEWTGARIENFHQKPRSAARVGREDEDVPDLLDMHLRADKKLEKHTATILAKMFRAAYEEAIVEGNKKKE